MIKKTPSLYRLIKNDYPSFLAFLGILLIALGITGYQIFGFLEFLTRFGPGAALGLLVVLVIRIQFVRSVFLYGRAVAGHVTNIRFFRGRGRADFVYTYQDRKYNSYNPVNSTKDTKALQVGQPITVIVSPGKPKRAFIADLYLETVPDAIDYAEPVQAEIDVPDRGLQIRGTYQRSSFTRALWRISIPSWYGHVWRLVILSIFISYFVIIAVTGDLSRVQDAGFWRRSVLFLFLFAYFIYPYLSPWLTARKFFQSRLAYQPIIGWANERGIAYASHPWYKPNIPWPVVSKIVVSRNWVGLLTVESEFLMLRPDFFQTESDWEQFNQLIQNHVIEAK